MINAGRMKNSLKKLSAAVFFFVFLTFSVASVPAFAQEAEHKSGEASGSAEKGSAEKSGEEKPGMELWKWANFAILAGILGYLISKNLGPVLVDRSRQIQEGLAAGERAKADADARAAAVAAKLAGLGQTVASMQADARIEREREGIRIQRDTAAELTRIQQNAAFDIESASKLARIAVQRQAAKLAIELAEQKVRARMTPELQAALLQNFYGELGSASVGAGKLS